MTTSVFRLFFLLLTLVTSCNSEDQVAQTTPMDLLTPIIVIPSETDFAVNTYTDPNQQEVHICYLNINTAPRNQLLVFLPGSSGKPNGNDYFDELAANLGYHVIGLMYPNVPSIGSLCDTSTDLDCFLKARTEIIEGVERSDLVDVDRANSIENRLTKCILYLQFEFPTQNWGQYLDVNGDIIWEKIAIGGHSQGGGHAALIAKNHKVARVLCLASPKDNFRKPTTESPQYLGKIAPWIDENSLTPPDRYYTFTHIKDQTGASPAEQQIIFDNLGLRQIADSVSVDANESPYENTRILMTYLSMANGGTVNAHGCVLVDNSVPDIQLTGINRFQEAWIYMLTH